MNATIIQTQTRFKDGRNFDMGTFPVTIERALKTLIEFELGYGGRVTTYMCGVVEVQTSILNCLDRTRWEFHPESDEFGFVRDYCQVHSIVNSTLTDAEIQRVMSVTQGNPLLIKLGSGVLLGESRSKRSMIAFLLRGETNQDALANDVKILISKTFRELMDLVVLSFTDRLTVKEIIELAQ
jgi:hypothetical protein